MFQHNRLLKLRHRTAGFLFRKDNFIVFHLLSDLTGHIIHKCAFLIRAASNYKNTGKDQCKQQDERDQFLSIGSRNGLFGRLCCHGNPFFLYLLAGLFPAAKELVILANFIRLDFRIVIPVQIAEKS